MKTCEQLLEEERRKSLEYAKHVNVNTWARQRLDILVDMVEDRISNPSYFPISYEWLATELKRIKSGLWIN